MEAVLSRLRIRRRRRPPDRIVLIVLWVVLTLTNIAISVVKLLNGDAFYGFALVAYGACYWGWRRILQRQLVRLENDRPVERVGPFEWAVVTAMVLVTFMRL